MKLLVLGHPDTVLGFSLVGVSGVAAASADEANLALDEALVRTDIGIILVTEDIAGLIGARMEQLKMRSLVPLVVEIPAPGGRSTSQPALSELIMRAIGVKI